MHKSKTKGIQEIKSVDDKETKDKALALVLLCQNDYDGLCKKTLMKFINLWNGRCPVNRW